MSSIARPPNPFVTEAAWQVPALRDIFLLPGDWALYLMGSYAPSLGAWLGIDAADYGSAGAAVLAFWFWLLLSLALIMASAAVRRFDRALTGVVAKAYADVRYRLRLLRTLAAYRRRAPQRVEPTFDER
jgi:hypothetical protein